MHEVWINPNWRENNQRQTCTNFSDRIYLWERNPIHMDIFLLGQNMSAHKKSFRVSSKWVKSNERKKERDKEKLSVLTMASYASIRHHGWSKQAARTNIIIMMQSYNRCEDIYFMHLFRLQTITITIYVVEHITIFQRNMVLKLEAFKLGSGGCQNPYKSTH